MATKKKSTTKKQADKKAEKAPKGPTIGETAIGVLKAGKHPENVSLAQHALNVVKAAFPDAKTEMASIYWYASKEGVKLQGTAPKKEKKVHKVAVAKGKAAKKKGPGPMVTKGKGKVLAPKSQQSEAPAEAPAEQASAAVA